MRKFLALVALMLAACQTVQTTRPGAVGVDRPQKMLLSANEVNRAAEKGYHDMLLEARKKGTLDRDAFLLARVQRITQRLIHAAPQLRPDASGWAWEVHVFTTRELNAWCMPGGKMGINTGLIEKLSLTDDEIAAVMGHEMSHALREHGREQASQQFATQLGIAVIGAAAGLGAGGQDLVKMVSDVTFGLPNSRLAETEADHLGVELAARAGYNPYAAVSLWEKMNRVSSGEPPQWLSTHPGHQHRQADLRQVAERVMPIYEGQTRGR